MIVLRLKSMLDGSLKHNIPASPSFDKKRPGHSLLADPKLPAERYGTFAVATSPRGLTEAKYGGLKN